MIRVLDRVDLVVVGAEAAGIDPCELVDGVDVGVLVLLEARLSLARTVPAAAAEALVTIAASRPFPRENRVAAWLAAAHVVALNGRELDLDIGLAVRLVDDAAAGRCDERDVAAVLAAHVHGPLTGPLHRLADRVAGLVRPPRPTPPLRRCPRCQRVVSAGALRYPHPWAVVSPDRLVSGCVRQHAAHDRDGQPIAPDGAPMTAGPAPLVRGSVDDGARDAFVVLTDRGPVLLRPASESDRAVTYDLFVLDELPLSGLVGHWDRLLGDREPVARVALDAGPLDRGRAHLDWQEVRTVVEAVPA